MDPPMNLYRLTKITERVDTTIDLCKTLGNIPTRNTVSKL